MFKRDRNNGDSLGTTRKELNTYTKVCPVNGAVPSSAWVCDSNFFLKRKLLTHLKYHSRKTRTYDELNQARKQFCDCTGYLRISEQQNDPGYVPFPSTIANLQIKQNISPRKIQSKQTVPPTLFNSTIRIIFIF